MTSNATASKNPRLRGAHDGHKAPRHRNILIACLMLSMVAVAWASESANPELVTFVFQHRAVPGRDGQFVVRTTDTKVIEIARNQLAIPEKDRRLFISGRLAAGGSINEPWSWHIVDNNWEFVEVTIELCDGTPQMVENNVQYWVNEVKRYCPWKAYVLDERR